MHRVDHLRWALPFPRTGSALSAWVDCSEQAACSQRGHLERVEPLDQVRIPFPPWTSGCRRRQALECRALRREVRLCVKVRRVEVGMAQPAANHGNVGPGAHQRNGSGVAEGVGCDPLLERSRRRLRRGGDIPRQLVPYARSPEWSAISTDENRFVFCPWLAPKQRPDQCRGLWPQGTESLLAALPEEANAGRRLETYISRAHVQSFLNTRSGVVQEMKERVVTLPFRTVGIDRTDDALDLARLEMGRRAHHGTLRRDVQDGRTLGNRKGFPACNKGVEAP